MNVGFVKSPIGWLKITQENGALSEVHFVDDDANNYAEPTDGILKVCSLQLTEYFEGRRTVFDIPLAPIGTDFQKTVWKELQSIPFGKTISYMDMAKRLGDPKVIRAAGTANGKNPIAIIIPCHRVVGSDGSLTGYAGGLKRKQWLLEHESAQTALF
ncbi:MAG: methylated-DNA--[protein]-cysteine S-methyltransferase [Flavobacteriales bacterium]|nr:methylated-DNA--[protein]-cysteine S-methyltransferase [Flavobacteriales bacterium]